MNEHSADHRPPTGPSKQRVIELLLAQIECDLAAITQVQIETHSAATHTEARAEHAKDTRSTETSYLARGLARRVAELEEARLSISRLSALQGTDEGGPHAPEAAVGSLLVMRNEETEQAQTVLLAPAGGGLELHVDGWAVRVATMTSPMGQALRGQRVGDTFEVRSPDGTREWTLLSLT